MAVGSAAISVAGSVSLNEISGHTRARLLDSTVNMLTPESPVPPPMPPRSEVFVLAGNGADIFAIAGSLSLSVASGKQGSSIAVSAGVALAVNDIQGDTEARIENATLDWEDIATGNLTVQVTSDNSIQAYTMAGAVSASVGLQGSGIAGAGAGSGSVNQIDMDTSAVLGRSTVIDAEDLTVFAGDTSEVKAGAGGIALALGVSPQQAGAAVALGAAFAVNTIGGDDDDRNEVLAEIDASTVTVDGVIDLDAASDTTIYVLAIGAAGSVSGAGNAVAMSGSLAGSVAVNTIRASTEARVKGASSLDAGGVVSVDAIDESSITADAGGFAWPWV